jgi:hypothetical protein
MEFKDFKECVDNLIIMHNKNMEAYRIGVDILDYHDPYDKAINILFEQILTEDGMDWLGWYLYEKDGISGNPKKDMKAWDNKKEICKNLKDLHSYLTTNNYFRRNGEQR